MDEPRTSWFDEGSPNESRESCRYALVLVIHGAPSEQVDTLCPVGPSSFGKFRMASALRDLKEPAQEEEHCSKMVHGDIRTLLGA